ncbi:MAG: hypothetical protein SV775_19015 [Thermodesulfobacteriota bacterium]|nr:hypothetical protein [Thermodesulfobacteriota bacterium]
MVNNKKTEFKTLIEVAEYLKAEGWKVSQSTVYKHQTEGRIRPNSEGIYTLKAVQKYARTHLTQQETALKVDDEQLQRKKLLAEVAWKTEQAKREQIKRMAEEGLFILREDLDREMAARASVLEAGLNFLIQSKANEWVALVNGDEKKAGDLVRDITTGLNDALNEFATVKEFQVLLKANAENVSEESG